MSAAASSAPKAAGNATHLPACGFTVHGGKNGNLPIKVEKRPKGKKVTVISNVQGSAKALLSALSSLLGCGGTLQQQASGQHWTVEVQGEQTDRVSAALTQLGCLRGIKKDVEAKEKKKTVDVATRVCAYDKFLKQGEPDKSEEKKKKDAAYAYEQFPVPGADCSKWHGPWIYCRGNCQKTDLSDVWVESLADSDAQGAICGTCQPPTSTAELNLTLQSLGMLAETGHAVRDALGTGSRNRGVSLAQYRRMALAPGARLIDEEPAAGSKARAKSRAASRARSRPRVEAEAEGAGGRAYSRSCAPRRPAPPPVRPRPPPKVGNYACPFCACAFGLHRTLKLHLKNAHPSMQVPKPGAGVASAMLSGLAGPAEPSGVSLAGRWGPGLSPDVAALARAWAPPGAPESAAAAPAAARAARPASAAPRAASAAPRAASAAPRRAAPAQPGRSEEAEGGRRHRQAGGGGGLQAQKAQECPICLKLVAKKDLEEHVEECLAQASAAYTSKAEHSRAGKSKQASPRGGASAAGPAVQAPEAVGVGGAGEDAAPDRYRVREDFFPTDETQIAVKCGMEVVVSWRQPPQEGGYWAWVQLLADGNSVGYVPQKCLSPLQRAATEPASTEEGGREAAATTEGTEGAIPEDWLGTFLELDLDEEKAGEFWESFEVLKGKGLSLEDAWLAALNGLHGGPTAPALAASVLGAPGAESESEAERDPHGATASTTPGAKGARPSGQHALDCLPVGEVQMMEIVLDVSDRWEPQDETQLSVVGGERFTVNWVQPPEEGGFWIYGSIGGSSDWGYLPKTVLALPSHDAGGGGSSSSTAPSRGRAGGEAAGQAPGKAAGQASGQAASQTASQAAGRAAGQGAVQGGGEASSQGGDQSGSQGSGQGGLAIRRWRKQRQQAAEEGQEVAPPGAAAAAQTRDAASRTGAGPPPPPRAAGPVTPWPGTGEGGSPGRGRRERAAGPAVEPWVFPATASSPQLIGTRAKDSCPICGAEDLGAELEAHVSLCRAARAVGLASEDKRWADSQLNQLTKRFCVSKVDPEVMWSALTSCQSRSEMQSEATTLLMDNQVVKNFSAELWSRRERHRNGAAARGRARER